MHVPSTTFSATIRLTVAALVVLFTCQRAANAQTATTQFQVTLTVLDECVISATDMAFGARSIIAGGAQATSTITVRCTAGTDYAIGLNEGIGLGATVAARQLTGPGGTVEYSLYSDPARTTVWGNTPGVDTVDSTAASGGAENLTVYGQIAPGQSDASAGTYTDTITATITYGASL